MARDTAVAARHVVNAPRNECEKWYTWHPGHTPREHVDIQMIKEQREWQASQAAIAQAFQERQLKLASRSQTQAIILAISASAITVALFLAKELLIGPPPPPPPQPAVPTVQPVEPTPTSD